MSSDRERAVLSLTAIAAGAAKLADDVRGNRLWEREYSAAVAELQRHLRDLPSLP